MKYILKSAGNEIEAFRLCRDFPPKWFSQAVLEGSVKLKKEHDKIVCAKIIDTDMFSSTAFPGDYIILTSNRKMCECDSGIFETLFMKV